jgi:hypothetical protein
LGDVRGWRRTQEYGTEQEQQTLQQMRRTVFRRFRFATVPEMLVRFGSSPVACKKEITSALKIESR